MICIVLLMFTLELTPTYTYLHQMKKMKKKIGSTLHRRKDSPFSKTQIFLFLK